MAIPGSFPRTSVPPAVADPVATTPGAPTAPGASSPVLQQLRSLLGGGSMYPMDPRGARYGRVFQAPAQWQQLAQGAFQPGRPVSFLFGGGLPGPVAGPPRAPVAPVPGAGAERGWLGYLSGLLSKG